MMKHLFKTVLFCYGALFIGGLTLSADEAKPAPQPQAESVVKTSTAVFDAQNKTFKFGSKEMIFSDNGTFKVISSGHCIASGSFFISTDFAGSQSNSSVTKLTPEAYPGGLLYVESCKVDEKAKTITVEGKLPFHKKNTPVQLGSWKQIAQLTDDGKVDITLDFVLPQGQPVRRTQGVTLRFLTSTGYTYGPKATAATFTKEQKPICSFTGAAICPVYPNKADTCSWEFPDKKVNYLFFHNPGSHGIYFTPHGGQTNFCHVRFNPN